MKVIRKGKMKKKFKRKVTMKKPQQKRGVDPLVKVKRNVKRQDNAVNGL